MSVRLHTIREQVTVDCNRWLEEDAASLQEILRRKEYNPESPTPALGLDWDYSDRSLELVRSNYFIGLQWLKKKVSAILVSPKIEHLDFMTMFMKCYDNKLSKLRGHLGDIYSIDLDSPAIETSAIDFEITPLLIAHFLKVVKPITEKGLKKDYIIKEEALNGKVKGKLLVGQVMKRYLRTGRQDILDCRYQDYSIDNTDNRIIKKALTFADKYLSAHSESEKSELKQLLRSILPYFEEVSDDISIQAIKQHKVNPLFREYSEALKVARMLMSRFGYSISTVKPDIDRKSMPPFWINMPLLFELYVYALLHERYGDQIDYHISTYGNEIDFVKYDEQLIIDTKYITSWDEAVNHDNVRQLSGYARNVALRRKIMKDEYDDTTILPCMVIYPDRKGIPINGLSPETSILSPKYAVDTYIKFFRRPISLPSMEKD